MLIKTISSKGAPIPYTPEEALPFAVEYGVRAMSDDVRVYWTVRESIKQGSIHYNKLPDGSWEAIADGSAHVGYSSTKDDRFHDAKPIKFKIQYKPTKDNLGLPDIQVVSFTTT